MNLYDTKDFFFIRSNGVVAPGIQTLIIEKSTTVITIQNDDKLLNTMHRQYRNEGAIQGIIGIMNYGGCNYLGVISGMAPVGQINKAKINKVSSVKLLPFTVSSTQPSFINRLPVLQLGTTNCILCWKMLSRFCAMGSISPMGMT